MKSRYGQFQCNKCNHFFHHHVMVAENEKECERLRETIRPPFAETSESQMIKQFDCPAEECDGTINVIFGECE